MFKKTKITNIPIDAFIKLRKMLEDAKITYEVSCNDPKLLYYVVEVDARYRSEVFAMVAETVTELRKEAI